MNIKTVPMNVYGAENISRLAELGIHSHEDVVNRVRDTFTPGRDTLQRGITEQGWEQAWAGCECYTNYQITTPMPQSLFGDSFGYDMQKNIGNRMRDYYAGKMSGDELSQYFNDCCVEMRKYQAQCHRSSGNVDEDNRKIVSEIYEIFAKENARAARTANYQEGKAINATSYLNTRDDDWTYYNADYYYKCDETKEALRQSALKMTEKWDLDAIDCDEIEKNSKLTLDGGFDFNSSWNWCFRNQVGRSSMATEREVPPKDFKMFFKENVTPDAKNIDEAFKGNLEIIIGESKYNVDVPFKILRTGLEGEIFNAWDLTKDHFSETEDSPEIKKFLSKISVFTQWYSYETKINDKFGDYVV